MVVCGELVEAQEKKKRNNRGLCHGIIDNFSKKEQRIVAIISVRVAGLQPRCEQGTSRRLLF
jgi:hypothetical protein